MSVKHISCEGLAILVEVKLALLEEMKRRGVTLYRVMNELGYSRSKIYGIFREPDIDMSVALFLEITKVIGIPPRKIIERVFSSPLLQSIKKYRNTPEKCKEEVLKYWNEKLKEVKS